MGQADAAARRLASPRPWHAQAMSPGRPAALLAGGHGPAGQELDSIGLGSEGQSAATETLGLGLEARASRPPRPAWPESQSPTSGPRAAAGSGRHAALAALPAADRANNGRITLPIIRWCLAFLVRIALYFFFVIHSFACPAALLLK